MLPNFTKFCQSLLNSLAKFWQRVQSYPKRVEPFDAVQRLGEPWAWPGKSGLRQAE
jgi:hypothetical protein